MNDHYALFARFIAFNPEADNRVTIGHVMRQSGGAANPERITDWWNQWQTMRAALKDWGPKDD